MTEPRPPKRGKSAQMVSEINDNSEATKKSKKERHRMAFMSSAFQVRYKDGSPQTEPMVNRTSKIMNKIDYDDRIVLLEKWENMPTLKDKQRARRLAFRQANRHGYRLERNFRVGVSSNGSKQLFRRAVLNNEDETPQVTGVERSVCHTGNIFDVIYSYHLKGNYSLHALNNLIKWEWSNIPQRLVGLFLTTIPVEECF